MNQRAVSDEYAVMKNDLHVKIVSKASDHAKVISPEPFSKTLRECSRSLCQTDLTRSVTLQSLLA